METKDLIRAYKALLDAAEAITDDRPVTESHRAQIDWTLAHIALSDRALAGAARAVLSSRAARLDNTHAMSKPEIAAVLSSTTHLERANMVRRNAMELIGLLQQIPPDGADTLVRARLVNREGAVVFDDDLKWNDLIRMRSLEHIPGHTANLRSWA